MICDDEHIYVVPYKKKTLLIDIESTHNIAAVFGLRQKYIPHECILEERYIVCMSWKWLGDKEVQHIISNGKNDKCVIKKAAKLLKDCDEVVYHYGDKFDFPMLQGRSLFHGLDPISKPKSIDTCQQSRKHLKLNSSKLDYIAKYVGVEGKLKTGIDLWLKVLKGNKAAIKEMVIYCDQDIEVLEQVFLKLRPYIDIGYNYNISNGLGNRCPSCGCSDLVKWGFRYTNVGRYQRFKCRNCGRDVLCGTKEPYKGIGRPMR